MYLVCKGRKWQSWDWDLNSGLSSLRPWTLSPPLCPLTSEQLVYKSQAKRGVQSPTSYQPKDCQFVLSKFSPRPISPTKAKPLPLNLAGLIVTTDGYLALRLRCSDLHRDFKSP